MNKLLIASRLRAAKQKISDPTRWLQGTYALAADGRSVRAGATDAIKFCTVGAIRSTDDTYWVDDPAIVWLEKCGMKGMKATAFNDEATHDEVMQAFDDAILAAEVSQ